MERKYNESLIGNAKTLRRNMTEEERHLWFDFLRSYPIKFRRQAVMNKYIADFYSPKAKLIIELDGSQHYEDSGIEYDKMRTEYLEQYGMTVMRIPNNMINKQFKEVCEYIDNYVRQCIGQSPQAPDGASSPY